MIRTTIPQKFRIQCSKSWYITSILLLIIITSSAQTSVYSDFHQKSDFTGRRPNIIFTLSSGIVDKGRVSHAVGKYHISSMYQPYLELAMGLQWSINNFSSFMVGLKGIGSGRDASFKAPVQDMNPQYQEPFPSLRSGDFDFILGVPIRYEFSFLKRKTGSFFSDIGVDVRYSMAYDLEEYSHYLYLPDQTKFDVFYLQLNTNNSRLPWVTYCFSSGYKWQLRNKDYISLGVTANFSATEYTKGTYLINIPGHIPSSGHYSNRGTSLGLTCAYKPGFARTKLKKSF